MIEDNDPIKDTLAYKAQKLNMALKELFDEICFDPVEKFLFYLERKFDKLFKM